MNALVFSMFPLSSSSPPLLFQIFFLIQTITGAYMVINLFVAFLVGAFQSATDQVEARDRSGELVAIEQNVVDKEDIDSLAASRKAKERVQLRVY